ncbi:MAG: FeoC-like transcriptional regulator [Candidatus Sedimenticola sp. (ex Thyasira tokunagai)]
MILSDIKQYLVERHQATLADIALHFDCEPDAARGMLEVWIRKGKVKRQALSSACGEGCNSCTPEVTEIYLWVGDDKPFEVILPMPVGCTKEP